MNYIQNVQKLLEDCTPYVLPHHPYSYWIMSEYFPSLCFIVLENKEVAGFVCALHSVEKDSVFIWQLAVKSSYRKKGIAAMLCDEVMKYASKNNVGSLQTTINDTNTASIAFFSKFSTKHGKIFEKVILSGLCNFENESAYMIRL